MNRTRIVLIVAAAGVIAAGSWACLVARSFAAAPAADPSAASAPAVEPKVAHLPKPRMQGGMPLMEALKNRRSSRQFDAGKSLPDQVLSDLLWAAFGVNREDGRRTAPSAVNWQEIDIYAVKADGIWRFDAKAHELSLVADGDRRSLTGGQPFVKDAAVNLVYVADLAKAGRGSEVDKTLYTAADTGFIAQNVYLFCASEGLGTVVRGSINRAALSKAMNLKDTQRIILAQSVGYPPQGK